jgi:TolB-like protein
VIVLGALAAIALARSRATVRPSASSVAVLPLREIGGPPQGGEGERVTEELTTALAQMAGLTVRSASRAQEMVERGGGVDGIGRRLGVAFVVDGGVQRGATRLRVTLRLVRCADGVSVWAGTFDAELANPMSAAQQVASEASRQIGERLTRN